MHVNIAGSFDCSVYCMVVMLVNFSGYFIHDLVDIIVNGQSSNMWEVIPHHIAVRRCFLCPLL